MMDWPNGNIIERGEPMDDDVSFGCHSLNVIQVWPSDDAFVMYIVAQLS